MVTLYTRAQYRVPTYSKGTLSFCEISEFQTKNIERRLRNCSIEAKMTV